MKLIRELRQEIHKLKAVIASGDMVSCLLSRLCTLVCVKVESSGTMNLEFLAIMLLLRCTFAEVVIFSFWPNTMDTISLSTLITPHWQVL